MSGRNPVITGRGIITAAGCGVARVWRAMTEDQPGLGVLDLFHSPRYAAHAVGQVRADVATLTSDVRGSRSDKLGWMAAREALENAGIVGKFAGAQSGRAGVVFGATVGGMLGTDAALAGWLKHQRRRWAALRYHECGGTAEICAERLGATGPCLTLSTACSAGAMAILVAAELIQSNEVDLVLAGAADSLSRLTLNGFGSLLLLDPAGCRPFDAKRAGISLGEGAAALVVEAESSARARGARILARLDGWGASCDAHHPTAPHPEGLGAARALERALDHDAGRGGIDFVSAHGTGTRDNDAMEARALRRVLGEPLPPIASVKRFFGHTLAASGLIKAVTAVQCLVEQAIPGNPGFESVDPEVNVEPVRKFQRQPVSRILSNSFGFGGNNVALVFAKAEAEAKEVDIRNPAAVATPAPFRHAPLSLFGAGVVSPSGQSLEQLWDTMRRGGASISSMDVPLAQPPGRASVLACGEIAPAHFPDPTRRRRWSRIQQMILAAAFQAVTPERRQAMDASRTSVSVGTGLGALNDTMAFVENLIANDERAPRPTYFANSVHNTLASQVAIELGVTGPNLTTVQREVSFEASLWHGANELARGRSDLALVGAADELSPHLLATGMRWGWWAGDATVPRPKAALGGRAKEFSRGPAGEGAVVLALGRWAPDQGALARIEAIRLGRVPWKAGESLNAEAEATWIQRTLEAASIPLSEVDVFLTGAGGWEPMEAAYGSVHQALRGLGGRMALGRYKHGCGEFHAASAFGCLVAAGLVRGWIDASCCVKEGEWDSGRTCRTVVLYTLSPFGCKGVTCIRA
ncbi:MAG: beta-ketoacyl-[acyl-carrier-protein] synthase family protein [Verrucomicrobiales bacterium]|nr:beta-ketoacyl-[acyl-carrier-protein] synthase family protein [Verrucomicrobiales bacterium]